MLSLLRQVFDAFGNVRSNLTRDVQKQPIDHRGLPCIIIWDELLDACAIMSQKNQFVEHLLVYEYFLVRC